jgi:lipopolysaccharide/colanic/teichoic acid biosynthesis glycosyltransferase
MSKTKASASIIAYGADAASSSSTSRFDLSKTHVLSRHRPVGGHIKRAIDVTLALTALMVLAPLFVLVTILLRVVLGRSVLVAERHIGFAGKVFTTYRFRTSPIGHTADPAVAACLATLRDSQIDRLPQLLSILRGDMSFVGPRPVTLEVFGRHGNFAPDYLLAKPGLIGLRPSDRSGIFDYAKCAAELDRYYVRRWSVWLDLALLAKSVGAVRGINDRT